jgi:hypothetical protein
MSKGLFITGAVTAGIIAPILFPKVDSRKRGNRRP